jgi:4-hydroxy-2-oxoglutarate aldolase
MSEAVALNNNLIDLNKKISGSYGVAGVKYAMDLAGFAGGNPRMPLPALSDDAKEKIKNDLLASGFIRN